MKRLFVFIGSIFLILGILYCRGSIVYAHAGGPPYVLINGEYAQTNPIINNGGPARFSIGSDIASQSGYLINTPITFDIDEQFFPNPYAQAQSPFGVPIVNQPPPVAPQFRWDFGDGSEKQEGKKVSHIYTKPGTYFPDLEVLFPGKTDKFGSIDPLQLTVIPSNDYKQPVAKITVNGKLVTDPLQDTVDVKPVTSISFDGSASEGTITKYQWDFGDNKGNTKKVAMHRYGRDQYFPMVVLRVTDSNNIVSDTYALLNLPLTKSNPLQSVVNAFSDFFSNLFYRE